MDFEPDPRFGRPRPSSGPRNGVRHDVGRARPVPLADYADGPVDLVAVQADDELINALAAGMTVTSPGNGGYDADDQVAALLAAWRADVDAEPIPDLFDLDTAVAAVQGASTAARPPTRRRWLVPVAAAAAMVVISAGGLSVGAQSAEPGGVMWEVARVVDSERVESVEARQRVEGQIAEARQALESGQSDRAAEVLAAVAASPDLAAVREEEGLSALLDVQTFLQVKAEETPNGVPVAADAPLVTQPNRPVPPGVTSPVPTSPIVPVTPGTAPSGATTPGVTSPSSGEQPGAGSNEGATDPSVTSPGAGASNPGSSSTTTSPDAGPETTAPTGEGEGGPDGRVTTPPPSSPVQPSSTTSTGRNAEGTQDATPSSMGAQSVEQQPTASAGETTVVSEPAN